MQDMPELKHNFVTNEDILLSELIADIIPNSEELYFLVGYFYFSGFTEIYQTIAEKKIKILVGLEIEKTIINQVKEVNFIIEENSSRGAIRDSYNKSFVKLFNETDLFDNQQKQEAFKLFVSKIKDSSLEIRKTKNPNHAKLYLFERSESLSEMGTYPGTVITGSSNLTASGLKNRLELNVILRTAPDFHEGKKVFENLWEDAIVIADQYHIEEFEENVLKKLWYEKLYKPYYLYIRVLHEYFSIEYDRTIKLPHEITKNRFMNLKYQADAIKQALHTIEVHGGVIVSDVVGLGKSIVASSVAHNLNLKTIIIAPPHLVKQWDDEYRDYFDFNAKVFSSGSIDKALDYFYDNYDGQERLIIVDEAHKYRNEEIKDYGNLHILCQGNKVMLLTATPFNNKPQDIFSMVKLFQIPAKSTIRTVNHLGEEFTKLIHQYKQLTKAQKEKTKTANEIKTELEIIARQIRRIISPLVIRRSRIDLDEIEEYKKDINIQGIRFPVVNPPEILEYQLGDIEQLYVATLEQISSEDENNCFNGTRYKPVTYLKNFKKYTKKIEEVFGDINLFRESQHNVSKFMRHLLVRRFESSMYAFQKSLEYMIYSSENILNWLDKRGKVPIFKKGQLPDIEDFYETTNDDLQQELFDLNFDEELKKYKAKGLFEIDGEDLSVEFRRDLLKDIEILKDIQKRWFENGIEKDPKLQSFHELLKQQIKDDPQRKIIVFSEFADTVDYLYDCLKSDLRVFKYTSKIAYQKNKEIISTNFDAGIDPEKQVNDYDILLATDAISEGYNLHRAGTIFNFDIPYNPTRVIQRVGRINRINKRVFEELFIFNYFPTETGEYETRTKEISTLKIAMIQAILGEDTMILTTDEELKSFYREQYENQIKQTEERSWENPYFNLYNSLKSADHAAFQKALEIPIRTRIRRSISLPESGVLVFGRKSNDFVFRLGKSDVEDVAIAPETAIALFEADITEQPHKISNTFYSIYDKVKKNLFDTKTHIQSEKLKREVKDKIEIVIKENLSPEIDYLKDLLTVIDLDSLPKHYLKVINKLPVKEFTSLSDHIPHRYVNTVLRTASNIDMGEEVLILSEELI